MRVRAVVVNRLRTFVFAAKAPDRRGDPAAHCGCSCERRMPCRVSLRFGVRQGGCASAPGGLLRAVVLLGVGQMSLKALTSGPNEEEVSYSRLDASLLHGELRDNLRRQLAGERGMMCASCSGTSS